MESSKEKSSKTLERIAVNLQEKVGIRMNLKESLTGEIERIQFKGKRWLDERIKGLERKSI